MQRLLRKERKGFSVLELVLVIAIVVILSGVVGVSFFASREGTKEAVAQEEIARIYDTIWQGIANEDLTMDDIPEIATPIKDVPVIMDVLVVGGDSDRVGDLKDPWGNPYVISKSGVSGT